MQEHTVCPEPTIAPPVGIGVQNSLTEKQGKVFGRRLAKRHGPATFRADEDGSEARAEFRGAGKNTQSAYYFPYGFPPVTWTR